MLPFQGDIFSHLGQLARPQQMSPPSSSESPNPQSRQCPICDATIQGEESDLTEHVNICLDRGEEADSKRVAEQLQRTQVAQSTSSSATNAPSLDDLAPAERMIRELEINDAALAAALSSSNGLPEHLASGQPSLRASLSDSAERVFVKAAPKLVALFDAVDSLMLKKVHLSSQIDLFSSNMAGHGWDCGFRNIQMLMSALLYDEDNRRILRQAGLKEVPSVPEIAGIIEAAWERGFDPEGAASFNGRLVDKEVWIGATEAFCFFQSMNIAVNVRDFETPTVRERRQMFDWLFSYFDHACRGKSCYVHKWSLRPSSKRRFVAPIFCQYQGHSVTIVGVEKSKNGAVQILILDPSLSFFENFTNHRRLQSAFIKRGLGHHQFQQPRFQFVYLEEMAARASSRSQGPQAQ